MTEERELTPPREVLPPAVVGGAVVHLVSDGRLIWVEKWDYDGEKWISFKQFARELTSPTLIDGALVSDMLDEVRCSKARTSARRPAGDGVAR